MTLPTVGCGDMFIESEVALAVVDAGLEVPLLGVLELGKIGPPVGPMM